MPGATPRAQGPAPVKRSPLLRTTPLRARHPIARDKRLRQRRTTPRRSSRIRDEAYLAWLRSLPCCCPETPAHPGGDPHHPRHIEHGGGSIGAGMKADDTRAIPLSRAHHDLLQNHQGERQRTGPWAGWPTERVQHWHDETAARLRAEYETRKIDAAAAEKAGDRAST
jgi:hypothetical protein